MKPVKTLEIFGDTVDILVDGAMTGGASAVIIQTTAPGAGPPPHSHTREDEVLTVLEGHFEILSDGEWRRAPIGEVLFAPRSGVHTFRNVGAATGRVAVFIAPAGLERFFEKLSGLPICPASGRLSRNTGFRFTRPDYVLRLDRKPVHLERAASWTAMSHSAVRKPANHVEACP